MPEIPFSKTPATVRAINSPYESEHREALSSEGLEWLGSGKDSIVFADPRNPEKAIAITKASEELELSPRRAKQLFYMHNIFNTLFPHNFPHIYAAHGSVDTEELDAKHPGTMRERVIKDEKNLYGRRSPILYPFSRVKRICKYWNMPLPVDESSWNYIVSKDGGEYYLDMFNRPESESENYEDLDNILSYMDRGKGNYSDSDKAKVGRYIQRLRAVKEETEPRTTPDIDLPVVVPTLLTSAEDISAFLEEKKQRIEIGCNKTKEQLLTEMEQAGIRITDDARARINSSHFTTLPTEQGIEIVRLRVADLMQSSHETTLNAIYERMRELGLDECPDEVALHYRYPAEERPPRDLYFGTKPIFSHGNSQIFNLEYRNPEIWGEQNGGLKFENYTVNPNWEMFDPDAEFIFKAPESES